MTRLWELFDFDRLTRAMIIRGTSVSCNPWGPYILRNWKVKARATGDCACSMYWARVASKRLKLISPDFIKISNNSSGRGGLVCWVNSLSSKFRVICLVVHCWPYALGSARAFRITRYRSRARVVKGPWIEWGDGSAPLAMFSTVKWRSWRASKTLWIKDMAPTMSLGFDRATDTVLRIWSIVEISWGGCWCCLNCSAKFSNSVTNLSYRTMSPESVGAGCWVCCWTWCSDSKLLRAALWAAAAAWAAWACCCNCAKAWFREDPGGSVIGELNPGTFRPISS